MVVLLGSSSLEILEDLKIEIKSMLISEGNRGITLDELSSLYRSEFGGNIPLKDFNYTSLEEFLLSVPDAVSLRFDKEKDSMLVYHVESGKTSHLTSLIARQKQKSKKFRKSAGRLKHCSYFIDPVTLTKLMLKLSNCSKDMRGFKKSDLLSEIQNIVGIHSQYGTSDLNVQLSKLNNILAHDDQYVYLKNKEQSYEHLLEDCIQESTKVRLRDLSRKYTEGIWCSQLDDVYREEYGIDLEYRDLGFCGIVEFIDALPNIFHCIKPPNSSKYKVIARRLSEKLPIPIDCLNDPEERNNSETLLDKSNVIVSEICNPSLFWIILQRNKRKLIKLMKNLQEFYTYQDDLEGYRIPSCALKPGLHIACIYSNQWHRGIIKKIDLDSLLIFFYDYGTTRVYKANKVYFLHKDFSILPAQAIACSLYNVIPMESYKWTEVVIKAFVDKTLEKNFVASVFRENQENNPLPIDLIDTGNTLDVHLSQWMVSNGLAKWANHYVRPAKQLEALKKYKTRFQSFQIDDCNFVQLKDENIREALRDLEKLVACTNLSQSHL